jgi:hypothetical protein|tara:strand:+ start:186 stop:356 length:171 start_codon:yes stop_codon:yes gene_type:complete
MTRKLSFSVRDLVMVHDWLDDRLRFLSDEESYNSEIIALGHALGTVREQIAEAKDA